MPVLPDMPGSPELKSTKRASWKVTTCAASSSRNRIHRSAFSRVPVLLRNPLAAHPSSQRWFTASVTYLESETTRTARGPSGNARRASITARSSMRLLVVRR